jgi:hypothetical protein
MKGKYTLLAGGLVAMATILASYSNGPTQMGGDKTGSPLSGSTTCTSCHNPGSNTRPTVTISVLETITGLPVQSYEAGKQYKVILSSTAPGGLTKFGFQACMLRTGNAQAGTIATSISNTKVTSRSSVQYVEQSATLSTNGTTNEVEFLWTAPATAAGNVTVYAVINAVNGNNSDGGDIPSQPATYTLSAPTSVNNAAYRQAGLDIYPNPSASDFTAKLTVQQPGTAQVSIIDISGREVLAQQQILQQGENTFTLRASSLPRGMYVVKITGDQLRVSRSIIRQ